MDNFGLDVRARSRESLNLAFQIAFERYQTATHYAVDPQKGFVLLWAKEGDATPFPVPLDWKAAADMAWLWLLGTPYPPHDCNDHDVTEEEGWRCYVEAWGHVGQWHYSILAVKPAWCWYGK